LALTFGVNVQSNIASLPFYSYKKTTEVAESSDVVLPTPLTLKIDKLECLSLVRLFSRV